MAARLYVPNGQYEDPARRVSLRLGNRSPEVRVAQEWLELHGYGTALDGAYGPATAAAIRGAYRALTMLPAPQHGEIVNEAVWAALTRPMHVALELQGLTEAPGAVVVQYATTHHAVGAREVGGQNRGPWVRLYMDGHEGDVWAWCAGWATFIVWQAFADVGRLCPVERTYSCDAMARNAKKRGTFILGGMRQPKGLSAGDLFLVRGKAVDDWVHTGVIASVHEDYLVTFEGNSNEQGSREGYKVARRMRGYGRLDFVRVSG